MVLHNLTPHVHEEEQTNALPASFTDWLEFAFSIDPGAGHLECFSNAEPIDLDMPVELVVWASPDIWTPVESQEYVPEKPEFDMYPGAPPDIPILPKRGPPRFV